MTYTCWDESGTRVEITAEDAEEAAQAYVDDADYPDQPKTYWIEVTTVAITGEDEEIYHLIAIQPDKPRCDEDKAHDWQDVEDSLRGHGGGVVYSERCRRCDLQRITDTWAMHRPTGEQGLESVEYEEQVSDE